MKYGGRMFTADRAVKTLYARPVKRWRISSAASESITLCVFPRFRWYQGSATPTVVGRSSTRTTGISSAHERLCKLAASHGVGLAAFMFWQADHHRRHTARPRFGDYIGGFYNSARRDAARARASSLPGSDIICRYVCHKVNRHYSPVVF